MRELAFNEPVKVILLDIEGTTTPITFVYQVLFPYARHHLLDYLTRYFSEPDVQADLQRLRNEHETDATQGRVPLWKDTNDKELLASAIAYLEWLMNCDRKSTALKSIQGKIWEEGYQEGELKSVIFEDVPPALKRWQRQHRRVCIFSSGSVLAQKLLFAHTTSGDLTSMLSGYFDTTIGSKREATSYRRIAEMLQINPAEIVFISDVMSELEAASNAGLQVLLSVRPENPPQNQPDYIQSVTNFDSVLPA